MPRPVYGPIVSVIRAVALAESRLVASWRANQPSAERGAALVGRPLTPKIVDAERASMRRVEKHFGGS